MAKIVNVNEDELVEDYKNGFGLDAIASKHHIGKIRIKNILKAYGVKIREKSSYRKYHEFKVQDPKIKKYPEENGYHYVAVAKHDGTEIDDPYNLGGHLGKYVREVLGLDVPSLHYRRMYYQTTGDYWFEQFFNFEKRKNPETKKCPYCNFETVDINDLGGWFGQHLKNEHGMTIDDHLKKYPEDIAFFNKYRRLKERETKLELEENYVICPICNEKYGRLTLSHVKMHGLTLSEFYDLYPNQKMLSDHDLELTRATQKLGNLSVGKNRFISKKEKQIKDFLIKHDFEIMSNRQILEGREIDILIKDKKVGIEFNGIVWHSEFFGHKTHDYHIEKTKVCERHGYRLIHVFEDVFHFKKDAVFKRLSEILDIDDGKQTLTPDDLTIVELYELTGKHVIKTYSLEEQPSADLYIAARRGDVSLCAIAFKCIDDETGIWEMYEPVECECYHFKGVVKAIWDYFITHKHVSKVKVSLDRSWYTVADNPVVDLGFKFITHTLPDYWIIGKRGRNYESYRKHDKSLFTPEILKEKYNFPDDLTYEEMLMAIKLDRIWDCGRLVFEWMNNTD